MIIYCPQILFGNLDSKKLRQILDKERRES